MPLPPRILLHSPISGAASLAPFVEQCLQDGVSLIAVFGEGSEELEEAIDWLVIGDGTDQSRYITTSCHENDSFEQAIEFASAWHCEREGFVEIRL